MQIVERLSEGLIVFALVLARVSPCVYLLPYLGGKATPQPVKAGVAVALACVVWPTTVERFPADPTSLELGAIAVSEVVTGLFLGFAASLTFHALTLTGQTIDVVRAQSMATALVPQLPERVSVSADLLYQLGIAVYLSFGGHQLFVALLLRSYKLVPPGTLGLPGGRAGVLYFGRAAADAISLGVAMALPVIVSVLIADVLLGLINRAMAGLNVFFLGMPLKAGLGLLVLFFMVNGLIADRFLGIANAEMRALEAWLERAADG